MQQDDSYPDPKQLRAFAEEPMPFHDLRPADLEMLHNGRLRAGVGNVEYEYRQSSLLLEVENGSYTPVERVDRSHFEACRFDHARAWQIAGNTEVTEDYVSLTGVAHKMVTSPTQFDATWVLDEITITT